MSLKEELEKLFASHPDGVEAKMFLANFGKYCHSIDDLIDGDIKSNPENIGVILILALNIYSMNFYVKYLNSLYPIIRLIHHTYFDSVKMELASEYWQKEQADVLKSVGQEMTLAIIEILGGYEKRRELGLIVREYSYKEQHEEPITI